MTLGCDSARTIYTDAPGPEVWRATLGERLTQGHLSKTALRESVNWKDLWVLEGHLRLWGDLVRGKLVSARMDNAAAVAHANHGAGRSPDRTRPARAVKKREFRRSCTAAALPIAGR